MTEAHTYVSVTEAHTYVSDNGRTITLPGPKAYQYVDALGDIYWLAEIAAKRARKSEAMTADRDRLAALIWRWMSDNNDDYVENPDDPGCDVADVRIDATLNLTKLAGAILAARDGRDPGD